MAKQTILNVPLTITIREEHLAKLTDQGAPIPVSEQLASKLSRVSEILANEGMVVDAATLKGVEENYGKTIRNWQDLIRASEAKAGRRDGQMYVEFHLDETFRADFEQRAKEQGITVTDLLSALGNEAIANGWFFGMTPQGIPKYAKPEEIAWWRKKLGYQDFGITEMTAWAQALERTRKVSTDAGEKNAVLADAPVPAQA